LTLSIKILIISALCNHWGNENAETWHSLIRDHTGLAIIKHNIENLMFWKNVL